MFVFDQLLADAFESYAGSQPLDWINRYASVHGYRVNSALIKLGADASGFSLLDYLRHDQLFNQSRVSKAFAEFLADSKDEIERFASFDLLETEVNYNDWLDIGHDARFVPTYISMQRHIHRMNKSVRVAFFEMMLGCAVDYAQAFNSAVHQLVDKASSNAIASDFQEAKIIQRLRDAIELAGSNEKLDSAFQTITSQQQTISLLVSQQAPAQTQAGQVVASSKRGRQTGSKSVNPCRNALKKFWEKKGRPSAKHIIAAIHDFDYRIPNEFNLIKQGDYVIYRANKDDDDITKYKYKISSIERDLIAQFSKE